MARLEQIGPLVGLVALLGGFLVGCGSQRPQDVWGMPNTSPDPVAAKRTTVGYRYGLKADSSSERGDHPETAYGPGTSTVAKFWIHDEDEALHEARKTGRGLLISFFADWSDDCKKLDADTLRDPQVRAAIGMGYVPLRIDVSEETMAGRELLKRYNVDHVPAIIVIDAKGRELDRILQYVSEEMMLERLENYTPEEP